MNSNKFQNYKRLSSQYEIIQLPEKKPTSYVVSLLQKRFPNLNADVFKEEIEKERAELENSDSISEPVKQQPVGDGESGLNVNVDSLFGPGMKEFSNSKMWAADEDV